MDEPQENAMPDKEQPVPHAVVHLSDPSRPSPEALTTMPTLRIADQVDLLMLRAHSLARMLAAQYRDSPEGDVEKIADMIGELLAEARALQDQICLRLDG
jgi:hypothetical protein